MPSNSKKQAVLSLSASTHEIDKAAKTHRLRTEDFFVDILHDSFVQILLNSTDATYRKLVVSNDIPLDSYKFYYACFVANTVVLDQKAGNYEQAKRMVNHGLRRLVERSEIDICVAHGILSLAFHAINPNDTHNIAKHLIQATGENERMPFLRKRLADMGYTTPSPAGFDEHGKPYYRWKGKNGIAASLGVRRVQKKSQSNIISTKLNSGATP